MDNLDMATLLWKVRKFNSMSPDPSVPAGLSTKEQSEEQLIYYNRHSQGT